MFKPIACAALAAAVLILGVPAAAGPSTRVGEYTIHHNAIAADTLTPAVASAYGILRGKYRGVLNVSVIKEQPGAVGIPVSALVDVDIVAADQHRTTVPMREIEALGAVSYVGEFPIQDGQEIAFEIRVRPPGATAATTVHMSQEFFAD
jgi:hypothetical protein